MTTFLRVRLTYANITATIALFVALGGSAYAAISITGRDVRDHSLSGRDVAPNSIGSAEITNGSVRGIDIRNGTIAAGDLARPLRQDLRAGGSSPRGATGPIGPTGAAGPLGETGPKGDIGPRGDIGPKGDTGLKGDAGPGGPSGATGDTGPIGGTGPTGAQGPPGPSDVNAPKADTAQVNAATFSFGGEQRVAIGQQPNPVGCGCYVPGSGLVQVDSGTGRSTQLTHYYYGSTMRSSGPGSGIFEFFLGSPDTDGQAQLSVRNNGNGTGASVQARNGSDTSGLILDYANALRPRLLLEDNGLAPGATMAIENPEAGGKIVLATKKNGLLIDHVSLDSSGLFSTDGGVKFGSTPSDQVLFHGANMSGAQGADPGALPQLTAADVSTPADIATHLNEDRTAINALRQALLQQGLIGP
jgi:hypothetical protein